MISKRHITTRGHSVMGTKNPLLGGAINTPFLMNRIKKIKLDKCCNGTTVSGNLKGVAMDGYISGATVIIIKLDTLEEIGRTTTSQNGNWQIISSQIINDIDYKIVIQGGVDTVNGNIIEVELVSYGNTMNSTIIISPITTLVSYLIERDVSNKPFLEKLEDSKSVVKQLVADQSNMFEYNFIENSNISLYKISTLLYQYLNVYAGGPQTNLLLTDIKDFPNELLSLKLVKPELNNNAQLINGVYTFIDFSTSVTAIDTITSLNDFIKSATSESEPAATITLSSTKGKQGTSIIVNALFDTYMDEQVNCTIQLVDVANETVELLNAAATLIFNPGYKSASGAFIVPSGDKSAKVKILTGQSLGEKQIKSLPTNNTTFIIDNTGPVIQLNYTITQPETVNINTPYYDPGATAVDAVDGVRPVTSSGTINTSTIGQKTITYTSSDEAGNITQQIRTITVVDPTFPVITVLGNNPFYLEAGTDFTFTDPGATASDIVDGVLTVTTDTINGQTPSDYINGRKNIKETYTITYRSTDNNNNTSTATRTVIVRDTTPPVITLNPSVTSIDIEQKTGTYTLPTATAVDVIDGNIQTITVTGANNINVDLSGDYPVVYSASDSEGNTSTKTVIFRVRDTTPPQIIILGDNPFTFEASNFDYVDPGASATDAVDGNVPIVRTGIVYRDIPGTYSIKYDATDNAGNIATQRTRTVHVVDTTPPIITSTGDPVITVSLGNQTTTFDFKTGVSAVDIVDGIITSKIVVTSPTAGIFPTEFDWMTSVATRPTEVGTYIIKYNVSDDANNQAIELTRTLNVIQNAPPVLNNIPFQSQVLLNTVFDHKFGNTVTATDVENGTITNNIIITSAEQQSIVEISGNSWNTYQIKFKNVGQYVITYSITDNGNITTTQDVTINVVQPTTPQLTITNTNDIYFIKDDIENLSNGVYNNTMTQYILDKSEINAVAGVFDITNDVTITIERIYPTTGALDNGSLITSGTKLSNYVISANNVVFETTTNQYNVKENVYKLTYNISYNGTQGNSVIRYLIVGNKKYRIGLTANSIYMPNGQEYQTLGKYILTDISGCKSHIERMFRTMEDIIYRPLYGKHVVNGVVQQLPYNAYLNNNTPNLNGVDLYGKSGYFDFITYINDIIKIKNYQIAADYYYSGYPTLEPYITISGEIIRTHTSMLYNLYYYKYFSDSFDVKYLVMFHELLHGHRLGSDITFSDNYKPNNMVTIINDDPDSTFVERIKLFKGKNTLNYYKSKLLEAGFEQSHVDKIKGVPLESTYSDITAGGTTYSHWENNVTFDTSGVYHPPFYKDVMVGYNDEGLYISKLTSNCLIDIGYPNINTKSKYLQEYDTNDILKMGFSINYFNHYSDGQWNHSPYYNFPYSNNPLIRYVPLAKNADGLVQMYCSAFYIDLNILPENRKLYALFQIQKNVNGSSTPQQTSNFIELDKNNSKENYYELKVLIGTAIQQPQTLPSGYKYVAFTETMFDQTDHREFVVLTFYYKNNNNMYELLYNIKDGLYTWDGEKNDSAIFFTY